MTPFQDRLARIKVDLGAAADPERVALVARITVRAAGLHARALAGEDVSAELGHLNAQALNLEENVRQVVGRHLMGLATDILSKALGVAVAVA